MWTFSWYISKRGWIELKAFLWIATLGLIFLILGKTIQFLWCLSENVNMRSKKVLLHFICGLPILLKICWRGLFRLGNVSSWNTVQIGMTDRRTEIHLNSILETWKPIFTYPLCKWLYFYFILYVNLRWWICKAWHK